MSFSTLPTPPTLPTTQLTPVLFHVSRDLTIQLSSLWQHYFSDVPSANEVQIAYCRPWKTRLGLIRMSLDSKHSFIGINSLLRECDVPDFVLVTTIAHELAHYTHGFGSPLPQLYDHPHANNIVDKELQKRGLERELVACNQWIDENWYSFYDAHRLLRLNRTSLQQKVG